MKKEEILAKALDRGIILSDEQAENYTKLTDEELLSVSGGNNISVAPKKGKSTVKTGEKNALSDDTEIEVASDPC
jgi:hypothetical protein